MPDWPEPGNHDTDEEGDLADVDISYPTRGRPRLPIGQRRREKLVISLNQDELRRIMVRAAQDPSGPLSPQDWARQELLSLAPPLAPTNQKGG